MKPKIEHPRLDPDADPELKELAGLVGDFISYWGFKSVQGRMWCYLYVLQEPLNSIELSQLLEISPALVTQTVQVLLKYRVILEAGKGRNGVLYFRANPDVAEAISTVLSQREAALLEKIQAAQKKLHGAGTRPGRSGAARLDCARVALMGQWIALARLALGSGIRSMRSGLNPFQRPKTFKSLLRFQEGP